MKNVFLLICLAALSFWPCFKADFVHWDDDLHLLDNPIAQTHSPSAIPAIFGSSINKTYIPLTILSFNIEHYFFGLNPFIFHLNNFILHLLLCLVIYALVIRMGIDRGAAFLTALLFAIHPMHVESVAWVTQRKDALYSLFYTLALFQYWKYLTYHRRGSYLISVLFGFLSILAKPMALSLPLTLLIFDWYYQGRIIKQAVTNKLPYLLVILPVAWITYQQNARIPLVVFPESILIWAWSATFYIKKFFTPFVLLPLYQLPQPINIFNPSYSSSILILAATPFAMFFNRKDRLFIFACLFYICSTFFLWRMDNTVDVTIVGDRFMYLPSLGICLWLASLIFEHLKTGKTSSRIAIFGILALMTVQTFWQCRVWRNDITLWEHELKYEQKSALAYNSYGAALSKRNNHNSAILELTKALELKPDYALAYYNRGHIYSKLGNLEEALTDFQSALTINPKHIGSLIDRGIIYSRQKRFSEALNDLDAAQKLDPKNAGIYNNRGIVYKQLGELKKAVEDYNRALQFNPDLASAFINRARVWQELNNNSEALKDFHNAQKLGLRINIEDLEKIETLADETQ